MVIYSVAEPWGHAMLVEPAGDGLEAALAPESAKVDVFHFAPPLRERDSHELDTLSYLGAYEGETNLQNEVLKDVCAAMQTIKARATASPEVGLLAKRKCYSVAPSGILTSPSHERGEKTTSCAGLVEDCYRYAGVQLVDEASWPKMSFSELRDYAVELKPELAKKSHGLIAERLGVSVDQDEIRPLFTSHQMCAFAQNAYPLRCSTRRSKRRSSLAVINRQLLMELVGFDKTWQLVRTSQE